MQDESSAATVPVAVDIAPAVVAEIPTPDSPAAPAGRHFLAVFFLSFMWGMFGVDRFYLGKIWTGIFKLITFGGYGFWVLIDLALIMSGSMRDKQGNKMLEFDRYKKFAARTVIWFAVILGAVILVNGILAILGIYSLITAIQDGSLQNLLPSGVLPDTNQIQDILNQQSAL